MTQGENRRWYLLIPAIVAGLAGYYGPWVPHRAAGLVIIGLDLAEYVKFLPEVRSGQIVFPRELFYLPLLAASLAAALLASRRTLRPWLRVLCAVAAVPLALAVLPPAWGPQTVAQSEFRLQIIAIAVCLACVPGIVLTRLLPNRPVLALLATLCLAAAVLPTWAFLQVRAPIATLYSHPLPLGWGFWLCLAGFLAAAVVATSEALRPINLP